MSQEVSSNFSTLIEIGKYILPGVGGWFLKDFYDRRKRKRDISDLARGLKAEILRIKDVVSIGINKKYKLIEKFLDSSEAVMRMDWEDIGRSISLPFIPNNLDDFYKANISKLGMFDEKLINDIKIYYGKLKDWESEYKNIKNDFHGGFFEELNFTLDDSKRSAEWLIKTADNLAVELEKKIMR